MPGLFADPRRVSVEEIEKETTINDLYKQVGRLRCSLLSGSKNAVSTLSLHERRALRTGRTRISPSPAGLVAGLEPNRTVLRRRAFIERRVACSSRWIDEIPGHWATMLSQKDAGGFVAGRFDRIAQRIQRLMRHGHPVDLPGSETERRRRKPQVPLSIAGWPSIIRTTRGEPTSPMYAQGWIHVIWTVFLDWYSRYVVSAFSDFATGGISWSRRWRKLFKIARPKSSTVIRVPSTRATSKHRTDPGRERKYRHQHGRKGVLHGQHLHGEILEELQAGEVYLK